MAKKIYDLKELKAVFESTNDNKSKLALSLLDKLTFMENALQDLQDKVKKEGVVTEMCQGRYNIDRANPALQAYNVTIKNYTSAIKQLADLLPDGDVKDPGEDISRFIASGKK